MTRFFSFSLASLSRESQHPVSNNLALSFSRKMRAVMYVETETRCSSKSSQSVFELAARTIVNQNSVESQANPRSRSLAPPSSSSPSVSLWTRLRSPSIRRKSKVQFQAPTTTVSTRASRRFGKELSNGNNLIKIKCLRLKDDKSQEEIEIDLPKTVLQNMENHHH